MHKEQKLSSCVSLLRQGQSVLWLKVLGSTVHVSVTKREESSDALAYIIAQLKK